MRIKINEPLTNTEVNLDARPEDYNGEQGWRILFPEKDSFVIVQKNGDWQVMDEIDINPRLVDAIGKALHPVARYNSR
jgi:hypothetical protein